MLDKATACVVTIDLAGENKEEDNVAAEVARLTVNAWAKGKRKIKAAERLLHCECHATCDARSFELPSEVAEDGAEARLENGVLTQALPKRRPATSPRLELH